MDVLCGGNMESKDNSIEVLNNLHNEQIKKMKSDFLALKEKIVLTDSLIKKLQHEKAYNQHLRAANTKLITDLINHQKDNSDLSTQLNELLLKCKPLEEENKRLKADNERLEIAVTSYKVVQIQMIESDSLKQEKILKLKSENLALNKKIKRFEKLRLGFRSRTKSKVSELDEDSSDSDSSMVEVDTVPLMNQVSRLSQPVMGMANGFQDCMIPCHNPSSESISQTQIEISKSSDKKNEETSKSSKASKSKKKVQRNASQENKNIKSKNRKKNNEVDIVEMAKRLESALCNDENICSSPSNSSEGFVSQHIHSGNCDKTSKCQKMPEELNKVRFPSKNKACNEKKKQDTHQIEIDAPEKFTMHITEDKSQGKASSLKSFVKAPITPLDATTPTELQVNPNQLPLVTTCDPGANRLVSLNLNDVSTSLSPIQIQEKQLLENLELSSDEDSDCFEEVIYENSKTTGDLNKEPSDGNIDALFDCNSIPDHVSKFSDSKVESGVDVSSKKFVEFSEKGKSATVNGTKITGHKDNPLSKNIFNDFSVRCDIQSKDNGATDLTSVTLSLETMNSIEMSKNAERNFPDSQTKMSDSIEDLMSSSSDDELECHKKSVNFDGKDLLKRSEEAVPIASIKDSSETEVSSHTDQNGGTLEAAVKEICHDTPIVEVEVDINEAVNHQDGCASLENGDRSNLYHDMLKEMEISDDENEEFNQSITEGNGDESLKWQSGNEPAPLMPCENSMNLPEDAQMMNEDAQQPAAENEEFYQCLKGSDAPDLLNACKKSISKIEEPESLLSSSDLREECMETDDFVLEISSNSEDLEDEKEVENEKDNKENQASCDIEYVAAGDLRLLPQVEISGSEKIREHLNDLRKEDCMETDDLLFDISSNSDEFEGDEDKENIQASCAIESVTEGNLGMLPLLETSGSNEMKEHLDDLREEECMETDDLVLEISSNSEKEEDENDKEENQTSCAIESAADGDLGSMSKVEISGSHDIKEQLVDNLTENTETENAESVAELNEGDSNMKTPEVEEIKSDKHSRDKNPGLGGVSSLFLMQGKERVTSDQIIAKLFDVTEFTGSSEDDKENAAPATECARKDDSFLDLQISSDSSDDDEDNQSVNAGLKNKNVDIVMGASQKSEMGRNQRIKRKRPHSPNVHISAKKLREDPSHSKVQTTLQKDINSTVSENSNSGENVISTEKQTVSSKYNGNVIIFSEFQKLDPKAMTSLIDLPELISPPPSPQIKNGDDSTTNCFTTVNLINSITSKESKKVNGPTDPSVRVFNNNIKDPPLHSNDIPNPQRKVGIASSSVFVENVVKHPKGGANSSHRSKILKNCKKEMQKRVVKFSHTSEARNSLNENHRTVSNATGTSSLSCVTTSSHLLKVVPQGDMQGSHKHHVTPNIITEVNISTGDVPKCGPSFPLATKVSQDIVKEPRSANPDRISKARINPGNVSSKVSAPKITNDKKNELHPSRLLGEIPKNCLKNQQTVSIDSTIISNMNGNTGNIRTTSGANIASNSKNGLHLSESLKKMPQNSMANPKNDAVNFNDISKLHENKVDVYLSTSGATGISRSINSLASCNVSRKVSQNSKNESIIQTGSSCVPKENSHGLRKSAKIRHGLGQSFVPESSGNNMISKSECFTKTFLQIMQAFSQPVSSFLSKTQKCNFKNGDFTKSMIQALMRCKVDVKGNWFMKWKRGETSETVPWMAPAILRAIEFIFISAHSHKETGFCLVESFLQMSIQLIIKFETAKVIQETPMFSLCCAVVAVMRAQGNMERVRMLLYEVIKNSPKMRVCTVAMTICAVWPQCLSNSNQERGQSFSAIQQVLQYYVLASVGQESSVESFVKQLCGCKRMYQGSNELVSKLFEQVMNSLQQKEFTADDAENILWEVQVAVLLVCSKEGWAWTSTAVVTMLWSFLGLWAAKNGDLSEYFVQLIIDLLGSCLSQYLDKVDRANYDNIFESLKSLAMESTVSLKIRESALRSVLRLSSPSNSPTDVINSIIKHKDAFSQSTMELLNIFIS